MDFTEGIAPVTALERGGADLIRQATERRSPVVITQNGRPTAVLQDVASYERRRRALELLKVLAQGDRDHDVGGVHDTVGVDTVNRDRLAAHRDQASTQPSPSSGTTPRAPTPVLGKCSPPTRVVIGSRTQPASDTAVSPATSPAGQFRLQHPDVSRVIHCS